ncbi:MAG: c-type cytochrome [Verrucomicrobiota bacterium]
MKFTTSVGILFLCVLAACKSSEEQAAPSPEKEHTPKHPWDWIPEDPDLLAGREVYVIECGLCHDEGEEGAPSLARADEWERREAKGLDVLLDHAINGWQGPDGKMPARGGTPSLTDEQVTLAVNYMLATPK